MVVDNAIDLLKAIDETVDATEKACIRDRKSIKEKLAIEFKTVMTTYTDLMS